MPPAVPARVVWITGASSGIGAALAHRFAADGAALIVSARSHDKLVALQQSIQADHPVAVLVLPLDITDEAAIGVAADVARAWRGGVDVLVNNAGISQRAQVLDTALGTARRVMDVNFFGAVALTAAVAPAMVQRGRGHIVNITSVAAYVAAPRRGFYSASKHALRAWSNTLRAELGGTGVHVTMVCPGYVQTGISHHALSGDGTPTGQPDPQIAAGLSPDTVAAQTLAAIRAKKREITPGRVEISAIYLERFTPGLVAWVLPDRLPWSDSGLLGLARRTARFVWGVRTPPQLPTTAS